MTRGFPEGVKPLCSHAVMPSETAGRVVQASTDNRVAVLPDVNSKGEVSALEQLKQALPDLGRSRRVHTSAAMIGLALSVGVSDLLLHAQGGQALAVEPNSANASEAAVATTPTAADLSVPVSEVETTEAPIATSSSEAEAKPGVLEHVVQEGQTLWDIARLYRIDAAAIAASNHLPPGTVLRVGQILRIPTVNGIVHELQTGETLETVSETYQVATQQLAEINPETGEGVVAVPGNVNDLLKAKEEVALNRLKEKRQSLKQSLATLPTATPPEVATAETATQPTTLLAQRPQEEITSTSSQHFPTPSALEGKVSSPGMAEEATAAVVPTVPSLLRTGAAQDKPLQIAAIPSLQTIAYQVQAGDTLNDIANRYGTSQSELIALNRLQDPNVLWAGQTLQIPQAVAQAADPVAVVGLRPEGAEARTEVTLPSPLSASFRPEPAIAAGDSQANSLYRVNPGDTLDAIARHYGVSRDLLVAVNQIRDPNLIEVNQVLRIPQGNGRGYGVSGQVPVVTGIPVDTQEATVATPSPEATVFPTPISRAVTAPTSTVPATPVGPRNSGLPVITGTPIPETSQEATVAFAPIGTRQPQAPAVESTPDFELQQQYSPYVERLKAEVMQLRSRYANWTPTQTTAATAPIVPEASRTATIAPNSSSRPAVAPSTPTRSPRTAARVNPDLQGLENYNTGIYRRWQAGQTARVEAPKAAPVPSEQLLAAAPLTSEVYDPIIQQSLGRTVSPDLPALSNPDSYLPDAAPVFTGYIWPARGVLTSGFGWRWGRMHKGIDVAAPIGTPIVAAASGVVVTAGWNSGGYGNLVEIQHPDGSLTLYAHNNRILVRPGQQVEQGQQIAEMGSTGFSTGPHLHFEIHPAGRGAVNPIAFLPSR